MNTYITYDNRKGGQQININSNHLKSKLVNYFDEYTDYEFKTFKYMIVQNAFENRETYIKVKSHFEKNIPTIELSQEHEIMAEFCVPESYLDTCIDFKIKNKRGSDFLVIDAQFNLLYDYSILQDNSQGKKYNRIYIFPMTEKYQIADFHFALPFPSWNSELEIFKDTIESHFCTKMRSNLFHLMQYNVTSGKYSFKKLSETSD